MTPLPPLMPAMWVSQGKPVASRPVLGSRQSREPVGKTRRSRQPARSPRPKPHRSADAAAHDGLSAILDHLDEVLYVVRFPAGDPFSGTVQFVSGQAQAITGCEPREFVEDSGLWVSLLHPDDLPALRATTQAVVETRRPAIREYRLRNRATGEDRRIEDRVAPLLDADGNVVGMVGAARDVTQRFLAAEALRASEARLQAIFDNTLDAILLFDNQARLVDANPAALLHLGYTPAERSTLNAWSLVPAEKRQEAEQLWRRLLTEGSLNGDYVARHKDGSIRQVEYRAVANILPGLNVAVARDVTERNLAERALEARARYQAVVASLGQQALAQTHLPPFLDTAVRTIAVTLGVELCGVCDLRPESGVLLLQAGVGWAEGLVGRAMLMPRAGSQVQHVLDSGAPVVVEDLGDEGRFAPHPLLVEHRAVSGVCAAIHGPEGPLGVLLAYTRLRRVFVPDEIDCLRSVANVLGAAMVRARDWDVRRQLFEQVISAQDEERRRIARELHDETGQALTSLLVGLRAIQEAATLKAARERAETLRPIVSQTIEDVGRLARGLHPAVLDDLGLVPALRRYCADHPGLRGLDVAFDAEELPRLPARTETTLYRIAQEALTNMVRHARARRVRIALNRDTAWVELRIEDDGAGFDSQGALRAAPASDRLGLVGIRERVAFLGGSFSLRSAPGEGTALVVRCPLAQD